MNRTAKAWIITAVVLISLGACLFIGAMAANGWNFKMLGTEHYVTNRYTVNESFRDIFITVDTTDITFVLTNEDQCTVECKESDKVMYSVKVENETLTVKSNDMRKWYDHVGITFDSQAMTVYLPMDEYGSLQIETDTGDITLPKELKLKKIRIDGDTCDITSLSSTLGSLKITVSTGNVTLDGLTADSIMIQTTTGKIALSSAQVQNEIELTSSTGDITLSGVQGNSFTSRSSTGSVEMKSTTLKGRIDIKTSTGDVRLVLCDADEIKVSTSTGDVNGTLLSEKIFICETSGGDIDIPKTSSGGKCEIITSTGDVNFKVKN